jgi:hypothetical protein
LQDGYPFRASEANRVALVNAERTSFLPQDEGAATRSMLIGLTRA